MVKALFVIAYPPEANAHAGYAAVVRDEEEDREKLAADVLKDLRLPFVRWANESSQLIQTIKNLQGRFPSLRHELVIRHSYEGPPRNTDESPTKLGPRRRNFK